MIIFQQIPLSIVIAVRKASGLLSEGDQARFLVTGDFNLLGLSNNAVLVLLISGFLGGLVGLWFAVRYIHQKVFLSVLTTARHIRWRRIVFGFCFWMAVTAIAEIVLYLSDPSNYMFDFKGLSWIGLLLIAFLLLPVQTSFEEIFMRGYLMQAVTLIGRHPLIAVLVTSVLFGLLHFANPEVQQFGPYIMMAYYIGVGIFLAIVTVLDEGLELALGIHAATNIYGAVFVNFSGSAITTDALFMVKEVNAAILLVFFLISMVAFLFVSGKIYHWNWNILLAKVEPLEQETFVYDE